MLVPVHVGMLLFPVSAECCCSKKATTNIVPFCGLLDLEIYSPKKLLSAFTKQNLCIFASCSTGFNSNCIFFFLGTCDRGIDLPCLYQILSPVQYYSSPSFFGLGSNS